MQNQGPDEEMLESLKAHGLLDDRDRAVFERLTGGVSSDIWKVSTKERTYCVKRALAKLKVEAAWFAPVERNRFEVSWYQIANQHAPGAAPRILAHDTKAMLFAMEFLDPKSHKLWKNELHEGRVDPVQARQTGALLGTIHAKTANDETLHAQFPRADIFQAIRLEPYLEATSDKHSDLKEQLYALSKRTGQTRLTMIHGDITPKNILLGPNNPVFLDAECACIGDPAFDIAFCLKHFLLKCLWTPSSTNAYLTCFKEMTASYLNEVAWEAPEQLEERAASLLPGLFLARVDGKSPVEYIQQETDKDKVRACARALLFHSPKRLVDVMEAWKRELNK